MDLLQKGVGNMSETTTTKRMAGAVELKRACVTLLNPSDASNLETSNEYKAEIKKNVSSPILIERNGEILTIAKRTGQGGLDKIEFQFRFKLSIVGNKTEWWPVFFNDSTGRTIDAEIQMGGKTLTNVQIQNELIDLANTWAKSIGAQGVSRKLEGNA